MKGWMRSLFGGCAGGPVLAAGLGAALLLAGCASVRASRPASAPRPPTVRLAVLPFNSSNAYVPGTALSDHFIVQLLQNEPRASVIERKDLMRILEEQKLTLTGLIRPERFGKMGAILGVDAVLFGTVSTLEALNSVGGRVAVTVKLVDVSSGRILWADSQKVDYYTWSVKDPSEIAEELMQRAARKMVRRMGRNMDFAFRAPEDAGIVREARLTDAVRGD